MTNQTPLPIKRPLHTIVAPARLVAATRAEFRRQAIELVDRAAAEQADGITIDLGTTSEVDASGLGILVLVQKRGREHGLVTRLASANESVRRMLILTRLDYLFEFVH